MTKTSEKTWEDSVFDSMQQFATDYSLVYAKTEREISAHFEIGCLLSLISFYEQGGFVGVVSNAARDGSYRYLTSPNGNPANFSFIVMTKGVEQIEIRQQVRISSHVGRDVSFTPDIVVIPHETKIHGKKDLDYAGGKRTFFFVHSKEVIAAHECKSMVPFPELLVSFIGMFVAGHAWAIKVDPVNILRNDGDHLAPCLFVGGSARSIHRKMIKGLKTAYPMNIVVGMHSGTWDLLGAKAEICRMRNPLQAAKGVSSKTSSITSRTNVRSLPNPISIKPLKSSAGCSQ